MAQYAYATVDTETLRTLCIKNNWFTCGTCEQYDKMFEANKDAYTSVDEIVSMIWLCSDDCSKGDIASAINDAIEEYRKNNKYEIYYRIDDDFGSVSLSETFYGGWLEMRSYVDYLNKHTDCYDIDVTEVSEYCYY